MAEKYRKVTRKFHDAWAFILYLIFTITLNTIYLTQKTKEMIFELPQANLLSASAAFIAFFILSILFLLSTIPKQLMHFSFLASPFLSLVLLFVFPPNILSIVFTVFYVAATLLLYFTVVRHNIKYSAVIVKDVIKIVNKNLVSILLFLFLACTAIFIQTYIMLISVSITNNDVSWAYAISLLQFYWTFFTFLYALRVFSSTIVGLDILTHDQEGMSSFIESWKNTMFSFGSICFGALMVAIIATCRTLHDRIRRNNQQQEQLLFTVLHFFLSLILSILEAIIQEINAWTFVYLALYGEKYTKSVSEAYRIVTNGKNEILLNSLCLMPCLTILSISSIFLYLGCLYLLHIDLNKISRVMTVALVAFFVLQVIELFVSVIDSATKAFLFASDRDQQAVKMKYPRSFEAMQEQMNKNNNIVVGTF